MSFLPTGQMAPFVPNMPVPKNVPGPFRLRDIPGKMWSGLQAAQADWKKNKELEMKLKEAMLSRILGQPQVDPMAQQKAGLNPAQFQLAAPPPIQKSTFLQPAPEAAPSQPVPSFNRPGSVLPNDRQFFAPMY